MNIFSGHSCYKLFSKINGKERIGRYGWLLNNMSNLYCLFVGNHTLAYKYALEAVDVNKKMFGKESVEYVSALTALSNAEFGINKTKKGLCHLEEAVSLLDFVTMDSETEHNLKEKLKYIRLQLKKDLPLKEKDNQANSANSLLLEATNYYTQGESFIAIEKLKDCKNLIENNWNVGNMSNYFSTVSSLSNALVESGNYIEADNILNESLEFLQSHHTQTNQITSIYNAKGNLYFMIGNVEEALHWFNLSKTIYENNGNKSIQYALLLSNLASCWMQKGELQLAKLCSDEAYNMCSQFYGENSQDANDQLIILNNLATIYTKMKDFSKGKELYNKVIAEASAQQNTQIKALALVNLAEIYFLENELIKAEKYLAEAKNMYTASYIRDMAEFDLLSIQTLLKKNEAIEEIGHYNERIKDELMKLYEHFSEAERETYWVQKSQSILFLNNLSALVFKTPETIQMAYDNTLYTKSMLINSNKFLEKLVKDCDKNTQEKYALMQAFKKKLSDKHKSKDSIDVYIDKINQYEKKVLASIPNFGEKLKRQFKSCNEVKMMLSDNEVAIEFVLLPQIKTFFDESELLYGALLLTNNDDAPKLLTLCSKHDLESLMNINDQIEKDFINNLYNLSNKKLYQLIWEKMEAHIPDGSIVYYSPTGYISKINLSAISDGKMRLDERFNFYEVSTTAQIEEVKEKHRTKYFSAAIYGNINYYEDVDMMAQKAKDYAAFSSGNIMATRSQSRGSWDLLPNTKEEVAAINEIMKAQGLQVQIYTQDNANEESFKALHSNAPEIIHVATHGFYFPPEDNVTSNFFNNLVSHTKKDFSMFYSGILFAGANNVWTGKTIADNVEDGILTAEEISHLDLSNNKLIVLSACNTGLGDIDNVDGVFGLQRGLKRAGVKSILMSLWKVPDEETKDLMTIFYKELLAGNTPHQSLKSAQKHLMNSGKSPYYWAGFILLD